MRKRKNEEIRRLVGAAVAMCDMSSLDSVKKKLAEAIRELGELDRERKIEPKEKKTANFKIENPIDALNAIDAEIAREKEKISGNRGSELFNG